MASELTQTQDHQLCLFPHPLPARHLFPDQPPVRMAGKQVKSNLEGYRGQIADLPGGFQQIRPSQEVPAANAQEMTLFEVPKGGEQVGEGLNLPDRILEILIELRQGVAALEAPPGQQPVPVVRDDHAEVSPDIGTIPESVRVRSCPFPSWDLFDRCLNITVKSSRGRGFRGVARVVFLRLHCCRSAPEWFLNFVLGERNDGRHLPPRSAARIPYQGRKKVAI